MRAELAPLDDFRELDTNPKEALGAAYKVALDESLKEFGFVGGGLVLTPRLDPAKYPDLCRRFGDDRKYILVDGNKRIERLAANGYRRVLVFPGKVKPGGKGSCLDAEGLAESGDVLREYQRAADAGEPIATGMACPDLAHPSRVKKLVLAYDRARARYDEGAAQALARELIDEDGEDPALLERLTTVKIAMLAKQLEREAQREAQADADRQKPAGQLFAERQAAKASMRRLVGPFNLTNDQHTMFRAAMDALRGTLPEKFMKILDIAAQAGVGEDVLLGAAVERGWEVHKADLGLDDNDEAA